MDRETESPPVEAPLELPPDQMRELGRLVVDEIVRRWETLAEDVPHRLESRDRLQARFGGPAPEAATDPTSVIREAIDEVLPLAGRIDHPRFMAFIPSSPTWPSVLGDFLAAGFNVFQGTWLESSGPSQIELTVLEWFREWLAMPEGAGGVLTSGGSAANLLAIALAREVAGSPLRPVVYLSDQGHGSIIRGARIAGIPLEGIRVLPSGADRRLHPATVARAVALDRAEGRSPILICANGGSTNTGVVDPLPELRELATAEGIRFHVDAAYGGFAVLTDEGKRELAGIGEADSITLDPHKWLFQPYECGCLMVRDTEELRRAFASTGAYLQDTELGEAQVNFADRGIQLTRGFRALKIWMSIRMLGLGAFRSGVAHGMQLAERAGARVMESKELELLAPPSLGIVCFRFNPEGEGLSEPELEELNRTLQDRIVPAGIAMVSSTRLEGKYALRMCILNYRTQWADVERVLDWVEAEGRRLTASPARPRGEGRPDGDDRSDGDGE